MWGRFERPSPNYYGNKKERLNKLNNNNELMNDDDDELFLILISMECDVDVSLKQSVSQSYS